MNTAIMRNEKVRFLIAAGFSLVLTLISYMVIGIIGKGNYIYEVLLDRGRIPYFIVLFFWATVVALSLKAIEYIRELRSYDAAVEVLKDPDLATIFTWSDVSFVRGKFEEKKEHLGSIVFDRIINALDRLHTTQSSNAMADNLTVRRETDLSELESSYENIRYFVWLIPTLGFIGTVLGIGSGVSGFANVIKNLSSFSELQEHLPNISRSLGVAFDTTLLALLLAAFAVFYMSFLLKKEELLLQTIDNLCFNKVLPLFQESTTFGQEVKEAVHEATQEIQTAMDGNRQQIIQAITDRLPTSIADSIISAIDTRLNLISGLLQRIAEQSSEYKCPIMIEVKEILRDMSNQIDKLGESVGSNKMTDSISKLSSEIYELGEKIEAMGDPSEEYSADEGGDENEKES